MESGGKTHDEAEGEEGSSLEDAAGHVAAVVALADEALVALEFFAEGLLAADEEEEHGVGVGVICCSIGLCCLVGFRPGRVCVQLMRRSEENEEKRKRKELSVAGCGDDALQDVMSL
jgi:hypothetical protein